MKKIRTITFLTLVKREIMRFSKVAIQTIFAPLISNSLYLIIFSYSLRQQDVSGYQVEYIEFIVPGLVMMGLIQNSFANTSSSLIVAKYQGSIIDLLLAPFSHLELTVGLMIGGLVRGIIVGSAIYLVANFFYSGYIFGPGLLLLTAFLVAGVFALLGIVAGLWAEKFDHVSIFTNFFITPLTFLSGVFYSVRRLPGIWSRVSLFNPVFYMVDLTRYAFIGQSDMEPIFSLAIIVTLFISLLFFVAYLFKIGYKIKE